MLNNAGIVVPCLFLQVFYYRATWSMSNNPSAGTARKGVCLAITLVSSFETDEPNDV